MDKQAKDVLIANLPNFPSWAKTVREYVFITFSEENYNEEENSQAILNLHNTLSDIVKIFIQFGRFKDEWSEFSLLPAAYIGIRTSIKSKKIGCEFEFSFDERGYCLESYIHHPENLKHMDDKFWQNIMELPNYGEFQFVDNACFSTPNGIIADKLFKNKKSNIFRLIKNTILLELYDEALIDIGWFSLRWSSDISWEELLINGCNAFKLLYKINYSLWRIDYLKENKRLKTKYGV